MDGAQELPYSDGYRLLLVEDREVVAEGLSSAFQKAEDIMGRCQVVCTRSLAKAADMLDETFRLVLLDLQLSEVGGDRRFGLRQLREQAPDVPIAIFSAQNSPDVIREMLQAGASGFIPERTGATYLAAILEFLLNGGIYVPPEVFTGAPFEASAGVDADTVRSFGLTARQQAVLDLLLRGHSNKEIARELDLTVGTVKNYVSGLLRSVQARTRCEIMASVHSPKPVRETSNVRKSPEQLELVARR
jgi:DNA-binding NarL/FixJ family response regulator